MDKEVTRIILEKQTPLGFPNDISTVFVDVHPLLHHLIRIKIYDGNANRYEVPIPKLNYNYVQQKFKLYDVNFSNNGTLRVTRNSTGKTVFETDLKFLIFADQYLQLTTSLASKHVHGLGEHRDFFRKETKWNKYITEGFLKVILFFNIIIQNFKYNENNNIEVDAFILKAE